MAANGHHYLVETRHGTFERAAQTRKTHAFVYKIKSKNHPNIVLVDTRAYAERLEERLRHRRGQGTVEYADIVPVRPHTAEATKQPKAPEPERKPPTRNFTVERKQKVGLSRQERLNAYRARGAVIEPRQRPADKPYYDRTLYLNDIRRAPDYRQLGRYWSRQPWRKPEADIPDQYLWDGTAIPIPLKVTVGYTIREKTDGSVVICRREMDQSLEADRIRRTDYEQNLVMTVEQAIALGVVRIGKL